MMKTNLVWSLSSCLATAFCVSTPVWGVPVSPSVPVVSGTVVAPSQTVALPLSRAMSLVATHNAAIQGAAQTLRAQQAVVRARWGAFLPQVSAVGQFGTRTLDATPSRHSHPTAQQIVISQQLTLGEETANLQAAKAGSHAAAAQSAATIQGTLLATVQAYVGALQAQALVSQTGQFVETLEKQKHVAEVQYRTGEATQTNILQAEARLLAARAEKAEAEARAIASRQTLQALGVPQATGVELAWPAPPAGLPVAEPSASLVIPVHPQFVAADSKAEALQAQVLAAGSAGLPEVSANAAAGRATETYTRADEPANTRSLTLNVTVPLFRGGQVLAAWQGARAAARAGEYAVEDTRASLTAGLASAWALFRAAQLAHTAAEQALAAQESATRGIRAEFKGGERSFLDLLDAEQALKQARVQQASARASSLVSAYALLAAMGQLTPDVIPQ